MAACPHCTKELKLGARFCIHCGTPVEAAAPAPRPAPPPPQAGGVCGTCGAALTPGLKFCMKCGTPVGTAAAPAASAPAPAPPPPPPAMRPAAPAPPSAAPPPVPPPIPAPMAGPAVSAPPPMPPPPIPPPPGVTPAKRSNAGLFIALAVLVMAAAGGWFGYQKWRQSRETPAAESTAPAEKAPVKQARTIIPPAVKQAPEATRATTAAPPVRAPAPPAKTEAPFYVTPAPPSQPNRPVQVDAPSAPVVSTPSTQPEAPSEQASPPVVRTPVFTPERTYTPPSPAPPAPPASYSGPASGVIVWSGQLAQGEAVTIDHGRASIGSVNGALPGVPVLIEITPADIGIVEAPGPSNGWQRISIRSRKNRHTVVTIRWRLV